MQFCHLKNGNPFFLNVPSPPPINYPRWKDNGAQIKWAIHWGSYPLWIVTWGYIASKFSYARWRTLRMEFDVGRWLRTVQFSSLLQLYCTNTVHVLNSNKLSFSLIELDILLLICFGSSFYRTLLCSYRADSLIILPFFCWPNVLQASLNLRNSSTRRGNSWNLKKIAPKDIELLKVNLAWWLILLVYQSTSQSQWNVLYSKSNTLVCFNRWCIHWEPEKSWMPIFLFPALGEEYQIDLSRHWTEISFSNNFRASHSQIWECTEKSNLMS